MVNGSKELPVFLDSRSWRAPYIRVIEWSAILLLFASICSAGVVLTVETKLPKFSTDYMLSKRPLAALTRLQFESQAQLSALRSNVASNHSSSSNVRNPQPYKRVAFLDDLRPGSLASLRANVQLIDVLIVKWLEWTRTNQLTDLIEHKHLSSVLHGEASPPSIWSRQDILHGLPQERGLKIWERVLKSLSFAKDLQLSGLCLENVGHLRASILKATLAALRREFRARGMQLCLIGSADELKKAGNGTSLVDYVVLRQSRDQSLSSLSPHSLNNTLRDIVQVTPPHKLIVEVGSFALSETEGNSPELTSLAQSAVAAHNARITSSMSTLQVPEFSYSEEGLAHKIILFDAATAFNLTNVLRRNFRCAGVVIASLGLEDPGVWHLAASPDWRTKPDVTGLRRVSLDNYVSYEGSGDLLSLASNPLGGVREITLHSGDFIISERFLTWPLPWIIKRWGLGGKNLVLTFDDGPDPRYTPAILDILKKKGVSATFFVTGSNAAANPSLLRRIWREGHTIGNHTFSHPNITMIGPSRFNLELNATERIIESIAKVRAPLFRSPYGEDTEPSSREEVLSFERITALGYTVVGISIDPRDWARPGVQEIVSTGLLQAKEGGHVILLHDAGGERSQTLIALPQLIDQLQASGFKFVSIADYAGLPKESVQPPLTEDQWWVPWSTKGGLFIYSAIHFYLPILFFSAVALMLARTIMLFVLAALHRPTQQIGSSDQPSVAVIIPAYNEERTVIHTVNSVIKSNYPSLEVLVIDDGSTDGTLTALKNAFSCHPMVRVLSKSNGGKASALNYGIAQTNAELVVLIDADTLVTKGAIGFLSKHFSDPHVAAVAGNVKVGNRRNFLAWCQALEYVTGQNFERRAYATINSITVVPGAIGAWRRQAMAEVGGLSTDTLAEDADLTWKILRAGYAIRHENRAVAFTEAPLTVSDFLKQRYRWAFGTLQVAWKHRAVVMDWKRSNLGMIAMPSVVFLQCLLPVLAPFTDLYFLTAIIGYSVDQIYHPYSGASERLIQALYLYVMFVGVDMSVAAAAFSQERTEQKKLLLLIPLQRFMYRQLLYFSAARALRSALLGVYVSWQKLVRTATVPEWAVTVVAKAATVRHQAALTRANN